MSVRLVATHMENNRSSRARAHRGTAEPPEKGTSSVTRQMQIGEVAELTGLSLRTIRYYEEVGLVVPTARSQGGFRLYGESDVERLHAVKRMKPLNLQLDEMRELLGLLDSVQRRNKPGVGVDDAEFRRLQEFSEHAEERCRRLREQLAAAEKFAARLQARLSGK